MENHHDAIKRCIRNLIAQVRTLSWIKGLRQELSRDEDSTVGIDVDPFHFEGTTVTWRAGSAVEEQGTDSATELTWRTGKPGDEQDVDAARFFDYLAGRRCIADNLKEGNKSSLTEPRKTPSDDDETKILGQHFTSETEGDAKNDETPIEVPPEIIARGSSALDSYFKALADGRTSIKRVPIMLIGQDRAGKTSLKKSLKGICFDPEEDSTVGIDVDPSHFKVTTETWRTGTAGNEQDADEALSFDYHAARWIVDDLKKSNESRPLIQTGTTEFKTASDTDETKITRQYVTSETEGDAKRDETLVEPATVPNEEALNNSSSLIEQKPKSLSDSTRYIPEEIAVGTETFLKGNFEDNRENIYSCLFDFAGQSVYYDTHPLFLTARAIYCLVYNLSFNPDDPAKPLLKQGVYQKYQDTFNLKTNFDYLDYWMRSVASVATATEAGLLPPKLPSVFLVCTHADAPYDKNSNPRDLAYKILGRLRDKPYGVHLYGVYVVDNRKSGTANECSEVIRLRQEILAVAEQLPYINEAIPIKWLKFEKAITALKKQKKGNKCISLKDARDIATNDCNITEKREIRTLLDYLNDLKSIIHFDDTPELNELVVLDPQWLIDVFKKVITVQPAYQCEEKKLLDKWNKLEACGLLDEKLLRHMWKSLSDDKETYQSLVEIMEKFGLMCPWPLDASGNKSYLVPSMLKSRPPKEISELAASSELPSLFLRFEDGHVPAGLFPDWFWRSFRGARKNLGNQERFICSATLLDISPPRTTTVLLSLSATLHSLRLLFIMRILALTRLKI